MKDVALLAINVMEKAIRAEQFGSYSMVATLAGDAVLVALEVDDTVTAASSAALMTGGDATLVVATGLLRQRRRQRLLGLRAGDFGKIETVWKRRPALVGLYCADSHQTTFLPWEACSRATPCTYQAFHLHIRNDCRMRRILECTLDSVPRARVYPYTAGRNCRIIRS